MVILPKALALDYLLNAPMTDGSVCGNGGEKHCIVFPRGTVRLISSEKKKMAALHICQNTALTRYHLNKVVNECLKVKLQWVGHYINQTVSTATLAFMRAVFYRSLGLCELLREIPRPLAEMLRYVRQIVANSVCHLVKVADRVCRLKTAACCHRKENW